MNRPIKDPLLKRIPRGPHREPPPKDLRKGDTEDEKPARAGGPAAESTLREDRRGGPLRLLRLLGPGLITGASDDDPSGIATYAQVGSQFGYGMLWTALFTFPLMAAIQELCGRIALETGVGLGTSLRRKFPSALVGACLVALLLANTINLGADLRAVAAGASLLSKNLIPEIWLVVPVAALVLSFQVFLSYRTLFRTFKWLCLALFAYIVTGLMAHPALLTVLAATFVPHLELTKEFMVGLVAVLGTTISPYLFFWQASSEIDQLRAEGKVKEAERRGVKLSELKAARTDILIGMAFSQLVMYFIILTSAAVLHAHGKTDVKTASDAAQALTPFLGPYAFIAFSLGLIGTGLLAIPILSGSAAYAFMEFMGWGGSFSTRPRYRPTFYGIIVAACLAGVGLNLVHLDTITALVYSAMINGLVAPPLMVLIVLLGSDRKVMRDKVSGPLSRSLSWIATGAMSAAAVTLVVVTFVLH
jgi:NRAMP (natural resistance-associated macrophage protein)-like metal ion transporter